jgi:TPR repeat protein|eukprot:COSAG02_NODE_215_length_28614_cov_43.077047_11_plen_106_part_00
MVQGDIDLLEFLTWVQHMSATPTGVTPNMVWYYKEQAARGNSAAILNLAVCHLSGVGMLKDSVTGVALMRDAASRGNPMAVRRKTVSAIQGPDICHGGFVLLQSS